MNDNIEKITQEVTERFSAAEMREHFPEALRDQFFEDIAATMELTNARVLNKSFNFLDRDHILRWWLVFLREYGIVWVGRYPCIVEDPDRWEPVLEPLWVLGCKIAKQKGTLELLDGAVNEISAEYDEDRRRVVDYRNALDWAIDELIEDHRLSMRKADRAAQRDLKKYDEAGRPRKFLLLLNAMLPRLRRGH